MTFFEAWKNRIEAKSRRRDAIYGIYNALVAQARKPEIYSDFGVPDTLDGRFDAIVLHIALFGLATGDRTANDPVLGDMGKDLIGVFLKDMDRNLREIGVGDLSVGKKVKKMASALYGRIDAYSKALRAQNPEKNLATAIGRNVFRGEGGTSEASRKLARYGLKKYQVWKNLPLSTLKKGTLET